MDENSAVRTVIYLQTGVSVVLGTIIGLLIAAPLATGAGSILNGALILILFAVGGGAIGYRRRASRPFLYLSFAAILILSGIVTKSLAP